MILKSVRLNNIRSYISEAVGFPEGSTLLAGDIGSGKSTILLAVEFALFGILRGSSSGAELLRNGANEGFVELMISLEGKDVIIKRGLKRSKSSIAQTSGYIIQDNVKKEGTPVELKAWIIDLLGYPKDLLTKSKSLIYRYTVYTPQEDMKSILFEEKELRLDTLRKVFNIDKYKRIRENSITYTRELKARIREFQVLLNNYEEKTKQLALFNDQLSSIKENIVVYRSKLDEARKISQSQKLKSSEFEDDIRSLNRIRQELASLDSQLKEKVNLSARNRRELLALEESINKLASKVKEVPASPKEDIKAKISEYDDLEKKRIISTRNISILMEKIEHSRDIREKVSNLNSCPLCLQEVNDSHKYEITKREDEAISTLKEQMKRSNEIDAKIKERLVLLKKEIEDLRQIDSNLRVLMLQKKQLDENINRKLQLEAESLDIKKEVGSINSRKAEISPKLEMLKDVEEKYKVSKEAYDNALKEERMLEIKFTSISKEEEGIQKRIIELNDELKKLDSAKSSLTKARQLLNWIEESFVNLMITMEKHVMMTVYSEFNELFMRWFNTLIEDETLSVRLDDEFTPVVIQNGYETDMFNLSGGEKTSLALAYRLALNKVINDMMDNINTKDIIILDEPTEGFSTEQLDKVRDVLDDLNIKQVLIVSHESKIESYVNNVIRVAKSEHISRIVS